MMIGSLTTPAEITEYYLATQDRKHLLELLQHNTHLLLTASKLKLCDYDYRSMLKREVEKLLKAVGNKQ